MNAAINDKDIYSGSGQPLKPVQDDLQKTIELVNKLKTESENSLKELGKEFYKLSNQVNITSDSIKKQAALEKEAEIASINLAKAKKIEADINLVNQKRITLEATEQRKANAEKEKAAKVANNASSAYKNLSQDHATLRQKAKDLGAEFGVESEQFKKAAAEANKLDRNLKKIDSALGQNTRNVGNYSSAWNGVKSSLTSVAGALGITAGIAGIASAFNKTVDIFKGFNTETTKLKAIIGATDSEMKPLINDAKHLGATTQKSAKEVAQLQLELAKKGFSNDQILQATEGILKLSIATGEDLAKSAEVGASTLNGFGLQASEMNKVVDIMANGFNYSSLGLDNFREAIKLVAPNAKNTNVSLETTTALLGTLADNGLEGSIAGTGLKNVLADLANENSKLSKFLGYSTKNSDDVVRAFKDLSKRGLDVGKSIELVGELAAPTFQTLVGNTSKIEDLNKKMNDSAGAAKKMADVMSDNLQGDLDNLSSATEALAISIGERLNNGLRKAATSFTNIVSSINEWIKIKPSEEMQKEAINVNVLAAKLSDTNLSYEERVKLLEQLRQINPDIVKGLEAESINYDQLNKNIEEYNRLFLDRLTLQKQLEEQQKVQQGLEDVAAKQADNRRRKLETEAEIMVRTSQINKEAGEAVGKAMRIQNISLEERFNLIRANALESRDLLDVLSILYQNEIRYSESLTEAQNDLTAAKKQTALVREALGSIEEEANKKELEDQQKLAKEKEKIEKDLAIAKRKLDEENAAKEKELKDKAAKEEQKRLEEEIKNKEEQARKILAITLAQQSTIDEFKNKSLDNANKAAKKFGIEGIKQTAEGLRSLGITEREITKENEQRIFEIKKEFGLASQQELQQEELQSLQDYYFENKLPLDENYFKARDAIRQEYAAKELLKTAQTLDTINDFVGLATDYYEAQKQKELKAAGDNEAEKEKIEKKYAEKQKKVSIAQAIINGASAILKNTAQLGFLPSIPINLLTLAQTAFQISLIESQGFAEGVIGLQGAGTETSDSIPAWLSKGESVITADGTKKAPETLTAINEGMLNDAKVMRAIELANVLESSKNVGSNNVIDLSLLVNQLQGIDDKLSRTKFILPEGKYTIMDIYGNKIKNLT